MEKKKRPFVGFTLLFITVGTVTLMMSLATDYWVCVHPKLLIGENNATDTRRYRGSIHYGLFRGGIMLNYGLGDRLSKIIVSQNIKDMNLMDYGMWITVVILHLLAIVWAVVAAGFTLFNLFGKPIETITGPFGLYVWNGCAASFTLLSIVIFLILFKTSIYDENIFQQAEIDSGWRSVGLSHPSWSFYINLGALGCFLLNILLLKISDVRPCRPKPSKEEKTTHDDFIY
ncbi:clarin-2 isoform X1 [Octopus bimaculoides]|uniref:clarin-2 isoform X1 n=1 Tax=Octopus bimaculoides TaxID=37653 RepID=UPI0022E5EB82|nr:clarin-2 isoform X1 [Octopus bimaculoides]